MVETLVIGAAILAPVVLVIAVAAGYWLGNLGNRSSPETVRAGPSDDCVSACSLFQNRQQEACLAEQAAEAAEEHAKLLSTVAVAVAGTIIGAAATVLVGLFAASATAGLAAAAASGPAAPAVIAAAVTVIIIAALLASAILALLLPVILALAVAAVVALVIASKKRQEALDAVVAMNEARSEVVANCSTEEAAACLGIPFSC